MRNSSHPLTTKLLFDLKNHALPHLKKSRVATLVVDVVRFSVLNFLT